MHSTRDTTPPTAWTRATALLRALWRNSPPLTVVGILMLVVAVPSLIGVFVDPRIIAGAPAWLKPFKFAISTALYSVTLAWMFTWLSDWPRVRRVAGWTTAVVFVLEVAIIDAQAWRGTTSHFNASTPLDRALFFTMGAAIMVQTFVSVTVASTFRPTRFCRTHSSTFGSVSMLHPSLGGCRLGGSFSKSSATVFSGALALVEVSRGLPKVWASALPNDTKSRRRTILAIKSFRIGHPNKKT